MDGKSPHRSPISRVWLCPGEPETPCSNPDAVRCRSEIFLRSGRGIACLGRRKRGLRPQCKPARSGEQSPPESLRRRLRVIENTGGRSEKTAKARSMRSRKRTHRVTQRHKKSQKRRRQGSGSLASHCGQLAGCSDHASSHSACSRRFQVAPSPLVPGLRRRWRFELPRLSHPSALPSSRSPVARIPCVQPCLPMSNRVSPAHSSSDLPAMELRVASSLASFGAALCKVSGFPVSRLPAALANAASRFPRLLHLPASPAMEIQVAPSLASFSVAGAQSPGYPRFCSSSPAFPMRPRVAPNPASSGRADGEFLGCPASSSPGLASL